MDLGSLGKSKVISRFIQDGYDVFLEFDGKAPFDLVVHKEGVLEKVEVKSTERRTDANTGWSVQIKKVRANKTGNKITAFSPKQCDKLVIYIKPIDRIVIFDSKDVKVSSELSILDKDLA